MFALIIIIDMSYFVPHFAGCSSPVDLSELRRWHLPAAAVNQAGERSDNSQNCKVGGCSPLRKN